MRKREVIYTLKIGEPSTRLTISAEDMEEAQKTAEGLIPAEQIFSITELDE